MTECVIIGAGLTGSLLAIYLAKRGLDVTIYERNADMRQVPFLAGRSINLAISCRGIKALEQGGIADEVMAHAVPMLGRMIHGLHGRCEYQAYGRNDSEHQNSISRAELNKILMTAAQRYPNVKIMFCHKLKDYRPDGSVLTFSDEIHKQFVDVEAKLVFAADGAFSAMRYALENQGLMQFAVEQLPHAYKELAIPPELGCRLQQNYLHIWPRNDFMMIALPNADKSFTCTLFMARQGELSFENINHPASVTDFFQKQFPDAVNLMPKCVEDYFNNPTGAMVTIKGGPWYYEDKALLIGDSAHAIVPFLGQGMNCAFEDCVVLNDLIANCQSSKLSWQAIFEEYYTLRQGNTNAIAAMAIENYYEMRDQVANEKFLLKKQIEQALMQRYPDQYFGKYHIIAFRHEDYAFAQFANELQQPLLAALADGITTVSQLNWARHEACIEQYFKRVAEYRSRA